MRTRDAVRETAHQQIMSCIGCNDCMLACPLPQVANITIAELNYAVAEERITNQRVIDFVSACTQCQQCVPVCPADLSRADMVLWNKLRVEDTLPDQVVMMQLGEHAVASPWTLDQLADFLSQMPLFSGVVQSELRRVIVRSTLRKLSDNEVLCREGTYHERLFVVLDGMVEQSIAQAKGARARILMMGPGTFHGEMAVLADQIEQFTVAAVESAVVLEIPKATLYHLMEISPALQDTMQELYNRRAILAYAQKSPVLNNFPEQVLRDLLSNAELQTWEEGQQIAEQGKPLPDLYLVRTGFLRVSQQKRGMRERVLVYFREGDTFGGGAAVGEETLPFTVAANTRSELIRIPAASFEQALKKHPKVRAELARQISNLSDAAGASQPEPPRKPRSATPTPASAIFNTTQFNLSWSGLIDQGVMQGHEVLVIDQSICTNCNNCVEGCGRRHGYSRLERSGLQMDTLLFPTACRHCEDPVCLLCSVNGIVRQPDGEISIVNDNCIGCGACADRCPYDNIKMHDLKQQANKPLLLEIVEKVVRIPLFSGHGQQAEQPVYDRLAVKCDLCAGYDDYACVTACPVGAAVRIDPVEVFGRADLIVGLEMKKNNEEA